MSEQVRVLPSGEVTFVFTDIEGSTRLLRQIGDERYASVLHRHHELLLRAWSSHGGSLVGTEGDSCFVAFSSTDAAVAACSDAQAALANEEWPPDVVVRVRMGVHSGLAQPRNDDYSALAVHQAARLMNAASGSQVFVSGHAFSQLGDSIAGDLRLLGRFRVRDFDEPLAIYDVVDARWTADPQPPRVLPADGHNIRRPTTRLLGRDQELELIRQLIAPGSLVTIAGPGGVGKTRLAIELGRLLAPDWRDGVWFVPLDGVTSADHIPDAIAVAAGLVPNRSVDLLVELVDALRDRRLLVVLDNCEHLVDGCAAVASELLAGCPHVGLLATSRSSLGTLAEHVWRLGPLDTELGDGSAPPPAIELFLERSEQGATAAASARDELDAVAELCRRLDGLPLAIELAAASAHRFSVTGLLHELEYRSNLPRLRDPSLPDRHRSLDELISWSYGLLDAESQTLARRLAMFATSFDQTSACAAWSSDEGDKPVVVERLWSLVDNSLVHVVASEGGTRYGLLTTFRSFLLTQLSDTERDEVAARLIDFYLASFGPSVQRNQSWVSEVQVELDNLRALVAIPRRAMMSLQQTLAWIIGHFHDSTDAYSLGIADVSLMLDELHAPTPERVALLALLADMYLRTGNVDAASASIDEAASLFVDVGGPEWDDTCVARTRGDLAMRKGDFDGALVIAEEALALHPSSIGAARIWNLVGLVRTSRDELPEAAEAFARDLEASEAAGSDTRAATAHGNLAEILLRRGDGVGAATHQLQCLDLAANLGQPALCAFSMIVAGRLLALQQRWEPAVQMQGAADRILHEIGYILYDLDASERNAMMAAAAKHLTSDEIASTLETGATMDMGTATRVAGTLLRELIDQGADDADRARQSVPLDRRL